MAPRLIVFRAAAAISIAILGGCDYLFAGPPADPPPFRRIELTVLEDAGRLEPPPWAWPPIGVEADGAISLYYVNNPAPDLWYLVEWIGRYVEGGHPVEPLLVCDRRAEWVIPRAILSGCATRGIRHFHLAVRADRGTEPTLLEVSLPSAATVRAAVTIATWPVHEVEAGPGADPAVPVLSPPRDATVEEVLRSYSRLLRSGRREVWLARRAPPFVSDPPGVIEVPDR
ncbi:MAG: hypothetical protein ACYTDY_05910 [Planctomycetota bacterium]